MGDSTIIHFEIPAENVEKLKTFYEKAFGWKILHSPVEGMDYWIIQTVPTDEKGMLLKPGVNGGMYKRTEKSQVPVNYINVSDIDASLREIMNQGGKIIMDKQALKKVGIFALCIDPEGNPFGVIQPEM